MKPQTEDRPLTGAQSNRSEIETLLALATRLAGAERAFLALSTEAYVATGSAEVQRGPSRTTLARALEAEDALIWLDAPALDTSSVRALELRAVVAQPVPTAAGRAALVLDARWSLALSAAELRALLAPFAALLARLLGETPCPSALRSTRARRDRSPGEWIRRVAATELPVLVQGESGAGKEEVAHELHRLSPRRGGPFVAVNCAALTESLLEAELFGAVRGAYTGAERDRPGLFRRASGGTLFLDEVGDMPPAMQAKLLRSIEQGRVRPVGGADEVPVDVRVVAATHRDLARRVCEGRFRHDLYYRLAVLRVDVPPLRERRDELPALLARLTPRLLRETGCRELRLSAGAWDWIRAQDWPGNVRELHAVLARALLHTGGAEIHGSDLEPLDPHAPAERAESAVLESRMIDLALREGHGSIARAARRIGWTRQKLYRRMRALGLSQPQPGSTSSDSSTFQ
jgi:transcriptional regulator of acetoin/glycerol metabolism